MTPTYISEHYVTKHLLKMLEKTEMCNYILFMKLKERETKISLNSIFPWIEITSNYAYTNVKNNPTANFLKNS